MKLIKMSSIPLFCIQLLIKSKTLELISAQPSFIFPSDDIRLSFGTQKSFQYLFSNA